MEQSKRLRAFHNDIKNRLLQQYAAEVGATSLLDIGTGRGGDMHKWYRSKLSTVIGIDVSKQYITDAIKRYNAARYIKGVNYRFYYTKPDNMFLRYLTSIQSDTTFDLVTCMFALHYFCKSKEVLTDILSQVASVLPDNGYFVCVAPLGERIMEKLATSSIYKTNVFMVERRFETPSGIGDKIRFMLSGTLYFGDNLISEEYLVFKDTIEECASGCGLKLVDYRGFDTEYASFYGLDDQTKEASFLNGVIVLQKCR